MATMDRLYTFKEWEEDYLKRKSKLKKVVSKDLERMVEKLEDTVELDSTVLVSINQMIRRIKFQLRKLYILGELFPLDIQDFPVEMILFDHVNHKEEMAEVRYILNQIKEYTANKENLTGKQMVQWYLYIIKCTADIIME